MTTLSLFPARASIGQVTLPNGSALDVMMTPEFSRALSALFLRIGGDSGTPPANFGSLIQDLAVLNMFGDDTTRLTGVLSSIGELYAHLAVAPDWTAPIASIRFQLDDLSKAVAIMPDGLAAVMDIGSRLEDLIRAVAVIPDPAARLGEVAKELIRRPSVLAQTGVAVNLTGTLAATVLATVAVPANALGKNGLLRITTTWSITNSANDKTIAIRFGGTAISSSVVTTASTYQEQRVIQNRNATNSQVFQFGGAAFTGSPIGTMAKDTTAAQNIDIVGQLANVAETITLEAYSVELLPAFT